MYTALLLKAPLQEGTATLRHLYVQTSTTSNDGPGLPAAARPLSSSGLRCLTAVHPGWPPVTLVSGPADRRIPTDQRSLGHAITGGGAFITFGDLAPTGSTVTSSISVSRGDNNTFGAAYRISVLGDRANLGRELLMWIS